MSPDASGIHGTNPTTPEASLDAFDSTGDASGDASKAIGRVKMPAAVGDVEGIVTQSTMPEALPDASDGAGSVTGRLQQRHRTPPTLPKASRDAFGIADTRKCKKNNQKDNAKR